MFYECSFNSQVLNYMKTSENLNSLTSCFKTCGCVHCILASRCLKYKKQNCHAPDNGLVIIFFLNMCSAYTLPHIYHKMVTFFIFCMTHNATLCTQKCLPLSSGWLIAQSQACLLRSISRYIQWDLLPGKGT